MKTNSKFAWFIRDNWILFLLLAAVGFAAWYFTQNYLDNYYQDKYRAERDNALAEADKLAGQRDAFKAAADLKGKENELIKAALEETAKEIKLRGNKASQDAVRDTENLVETLEAKKEKIQTDPDALQRCGLCSEAAGIGKPLSAVFCKGCE